MGLASQSGSIKVAPPKLLKVLNVSYIGFLSSHGSYFSAVWLNYCDLLLATDLATERTDLADFLDLFDLKDATL